MADLTAEAKRVIDAFNNSDWDALRDHLGDSTYNEVGTQRSLKGSDDVIGALQGWREAMPDVRGTVRSATENDQRVVLEITWEGTQTGPMVTDEGTIPPSGKHQTTQAVFVFDYENGELKESRHYFDMLTFLKQIGAA